MDKIKNYFLLILFGLIVSCTILNAKDFKSIPFFSFGSQGIGIGINYKGYNLYTRYHYKYEDNANYYAYYHYPSIQLTRNLYKEESGNLYVGLGFSNIFFKQKYFFPGTYNTRNYFISIPIGIEIIPFKKRNKLSVILESGIQFEHTNSWQLHYDWQLNLNRGIIDIRYKLGKKN